MTTEQTASFMQALERLLIAASEGVEVDGEIVTLRASEFLSAFRLLWLGKESSGYVNLSHEDAMIVCGTDVRATVRYHLQRLRKAGVITKVCTNGAVRTQANFYPDPLELVVHERKNSRTASTNSRMVSTNSRTPFASDEESLETREQHSRVREQHSRVREQHSRVREQHSRPSRNFDDYPQEAGSLVVSKTYLSTSSEKDSNLLTATAPGLIDPLEEAMTFSLMMAVGGFWPKTVKEFAKKFPFELVRRAIGYWDDNRQANGGTLRDNPGCVVTWLNNGEEMPELSESFKRSDLYRRHRTKAEVESDRYIEEEKLRQDAEWEAQEAAIDTVATPSLCEEEPAVSAIDEDIADIWQQTLALIALSLPPSTKYCFEGTTATIREGEIVIACARFQLTQLNERYKAMIKRSLGRVLDRGIETITIKFEVKS